MNNWQFYVSRKFNYFVEWVQTACTKADVQKKCFGFSFPLKNYLILNGDEYFWQPDADSYKKFLNERYKKDKKFFNKFIKAEFRIVEYAQKVEKTLRNSASKLARLPDKDLLAIYMKFFDAYIKCFATGFVRPDDYLEIKVKNEILDFLTRRRKVGTVDDIFRKISTYSKIGNKKLDYLEEPLALLRIAKLMKKNNQNINEPLKDIKEKIIKHWQKYQWLKNPNVYENLFISQEEFLDRVKAQSEENIELKIKHIVDIRKSDEKKYLSLVKEFSFPRELKDLMADLRKFIFLRTYTTEGADRLFYWARQTILSEISKRMGISNEDIVALTGSEIIDFFEKDKTVSLSEIQLRKKTFALVWLDGVAAVEYGKGAEKLIEKYKNLRFVAAGKEECQDTIKGQVASLGKVTGIVKVLQSYKEASKVKKGDILVVSMTTPDYITAMEKSAAFITDEGGITCHAAIISREMNKPCIIGTKIATKVFKDGDLVEVDAEKGVIKILRKR